MRVRVPPRALARPKAAGPFRARCGTLLLAQQLLLSPCTPRGRGKDSPDALTRFPLCRRFATPKPLAQPSMLAPAGRYYVDPSPNPFPRGRDLVGLRPPMVLFRRLRGRCSRGQKSANNVTAGRFLVSLGQKLAENVPLSSCTSRGEGEGSPSAAAQLSPLSSLRDSEGGRFRPECGVCRPKAVKNQPIRPEKPIFRPVVPPPTPTFIDCHFLILVDSGL